MGPSLFEMDTRFFFSKPNSIGIIFRMVHQGNDTFLDCVPHQEPPSLERLQNVELLNLSFSSKLLVKYYRSDFRSGMDHGVDEFLLETVERGIQMTIEILLVIWIRHF